MSPDSTCSRDGVETIDLARASQPQQLPVPGDVLGRYRVVERLGGGGYGQVFSAIHSATGHAVALKVMNLSDEADAVALRRFFREARLTATLQHPNIVRVFDFGQSESGSLYLAMERISGPTLSAVLKALAAQGQTLPESEAIGLGIAVLRALGELHHADVVHRDLKPANIMLARVGDDETVVKVLDLGIAYGAQSSLTRGPQPGTPMYMSPEQVEGLRPPDARSDIYSLGCILYHCVAGRPPFVASNEFALMFQRTAIEAPSLYDVTDGRVSKPLATVIMRSIARVPDERYPSARAMRSALESLQGPMPAPATVPHRNTTNVEPEWQEDASTAAGTAQADASERVRVGLQTPRTAVGHRFERLTAWLRSNVRQFLGVGAFGAAIAIVAVVIQATGIAPAAPGDERPATANLQGALTDDAFGSAVVSCFHPSAAFIDIVIDNGEPDASEVVDARVRFRGAVSGLAYQMSFKMWGRESAGHTEVRIEPGADSAPFPPAPNCRFRTWTAVDFK